MDLAADDRRPGGRRRKRPRRKARPEPYTDAPPGEPDPGCGEKELAGQEHGHAGRDVVPRDDGAILVRGVVADEHRHGIGLGKRAGPRPGGRDTDAADDQERADESVKHRAARRCSSSGPRAGRGAFLQGYIQTGATSPKARGGADTVPDTVADTPPSPCRASGTNGGVAPVFPLTAGAVRGRPVVGRNAEQRQRTMEGGDGTPPLLFL